MPQICGARFAPLRYQLDKVVFERQQGCRQWQQIECGGDVNIKTFPLSNSTVREPRWRQWRRLSRSHVSSTGRVLGTSYTLQDKNQISMQLSLAQGYSKSWPIFRASTMRFYTKHSMHCRAEIEMLLASRSCIRRGFQGLGDCFVVVAIMIGFLLVLCEMCSLFGVCAVFPVFGVYNYVFTVLYTWYCSVS